MSDDNATPAETTQKGWDQVAIRDQVCLLRCVQAALRQVEDGGFEDAELVSQAIRGLDEVVTQLDELTINVT